ncbi:MAG: 2-nitropropane dioxygenase, partial [Elusimicrobiota bacterium]
SFLEAPAQRTVATLALNLLFGASYLIRARSLGRQGVPVDPEAQRFSPMTLSSIQPLLEVQ